MPITCSRVLAALGALAVVGCGGAEGEPPRSMESLPYAPRVPGASAFVLLNRQVEFGPRGPGTDGHRAMAAKLKMFFLEVKRQFQGLDNISDLPRIVKFSNIALKMVVVAFAVRYWNLEHFPLSTFPREWAGMVFHPQVNILTAEPQVRISNQRPRQQSDLGQHLKTVANPDNQAAGIGEPDNLLHYR